MCALARVRFLALVEFPDASRLSLSRLKFFFSSNESTPREPVHIHVEKDDAESRFTRLLGSSIVQREQVRISSRGLHWKALDEDIPIAGLLAGLGDQTSTGKTFAA
jgi:hypothetical protein